MGGDRELYGLSAEGSKVSTVGKALRDPLSVVATDREVIGMMLEAATMLLRGASASDVTDGIEGTLSRGESASDRLGWNVLRHRLELSRTEQLALGLTTKYASPSPPATRIRSNADVASAR